MNNYKNIKPAKENEYIDMYKELYPIKQPKPITIFDEDKPLVLPEFNLKQGMIRDLLESKRPI